MLFSDCVESRLTQIFHYFRPRTRPLFPVNLRNLTSVWFGVRLQGHMATLDPSELNSTKIFLQLPWASELGLWCTHQEFKPFKYMRFLKSYLFVCSYPLVVWHHKGRLISKCLFGVFTFLQKTNENKSHI